MVAWKDNLIVFGGQKSKRAVQRYNTKTGFLQLLSLTVKTLL
jgi:hypothetical protein